MVSGAGEKRRGKQPSKLVGYSPPPSWGWDALGVKKGPISWLIHTSLPACEIPICKTGPISTPPPVEPPNPIPLSS